MNLATAIALHQLQAGGPGSGRHPGFGTKLKTPASPHPVAWQKISPQTEILKWANHPSEGIVFDNNPKLYHDHAAWFKDMGLPSYGKGFDAIQRGLIVVNHPDHEVKMAAYKGVNPELIEREIRDSRPDVANYSFIDNSKEIQDAWFASRAKRRRKLAAEFNPDQPRDADGKWTSEGGSDYKEVDKPDHYVTGMRSIGYVESVRVAGYNSTVNEAALHLPPGKGLAGVFHQLAQYRASKLIPVLDKAISKVTTTENLLVYRALPYDKALAAQFFDEAKPGAVIPARAFQSTTTDFKVAQRFAAYSDSGAIMRVHVPKGSHALPFDGFAGYDYAGAEEKELLLPRTTQYKVMGEPVKQGKYTFIDVEVK